LSATTELKAVASPESGAGEGGAAQNNMKLFVTHKMTRNNAPNKGHAEYKYVWRVDHTESLSDFV